LLQATTYLHRRWDDIGIRPPVARTRPALGKRSSAVALLVLLACLTGLAWLERERWLPARTATMAEDPVALCLAARAAEIDSMLADGLIAAQQAAAFKSRTEAMCRTTAAGAAPGLPPLPR
jgi:hypothetical protein